ncbi:YncE family protein [Leeuwenhoekiella sp. LLG6367-2.1]|uniref:YncE family protein n=1 Tax=Leeuwenhoekiella sp. LLG6367-2.1 TaxID=3160833 RepID=UPI00386E20E2|tara:strand:- start:1253 stop:2320 length:1068 start_codon:yes stop_codon:yes gene_type:complete
MKINKLTLLALLSVFILNSCSDDTDDLIDQVPEGDYTDGFFVLNEGGIGTVTYISDDLSDVEQDIFASANPNAADLGAYTQSIFFDDNNRAYIISNGSNLITVVDRYTFELIDVIDEGLTVPKYGVVYKGKAYVTNNNTFDDYTYDNDNPPSSYDDFIAVIDLETLSVESTIETNSYTEQIEEEDGLIYVNGSSFGYGNTINVINPSSNAVVRTISTAFGVNSFDIEDGSIYTLSSNSYEVFNKDNGEQISNLEFSDLSGASNLVLEDDKAYFTVNRSVYVMEQNSTTEPEKPLLTYSSTSQYGAMYGFAAKDGRIYIADGGDFSSDSFVEIYSTNGSLLKNITVGLGPNGFYFN